MVLRALEGKALAQVQDTGLGAGVGGVGASAAAQSGQRGHMDHLAVVLGLHDLKNGLGDEEHGLEVDVHHAIPAGGGDLLDGRRAGDAGHVHQNVDAPVDGLGSVHLLTDGVELGHIELQRGGLHALVAHGLGRRRGGGDVQVGQDDLCPVLGKAAGTGFADAAATAGDQGDFIFQHFLQHGMQLLILYEQTCRRRPAPLRGPSRTGRGGPRSSFPTGRW